jgi:cell division protein FtsL
VSPRTAVATVSRAAAGTIHAPGRIRTRPAPARRRSGALAKPRSVGRVVGRKDIVSVLDRLLVGPVYIAVVGVLLAGIVFFNVDVLELNHGIARTDSRAAQLKRENAALTLQLAKLGSSERIQRVALQRGLVLPQPGDVRYLRAHRLDAANALGVMTAPDPTSATAGVPTSVPQATYGTSSATAVPAPAPVTTTTPAPTGTTVSQQSTPPAGTVPPQGTTQVSSTPTTAGTVPSPQPAPTQTQTQQPAANPATPAGAAAAG